MRTRLNRLCKQQEPKDVLSGKEAAKYLGVSYRLFTEILASGELAHRRVGRRIFIAKDSINDWLAFRPATATNKTPAPTTRRKSTASITTD